MSRELVIYTDLKNSNFFYEMFYEHKILLKSLNEFDQHEDINNCGLVFIKDNEKLVNKVLSKKFENKIFLINTNFYQKKNIPHNVIFKTINIKLLKSKITNLFTSQDYSYKNLKITDNNIKNTKSNIVIKITEVEKKILVSLFENKIYKRREIKEKILNIKDTVETNSLDSHLTRIRKKLKKLECEINIISKDDILSIQ